MAQAEPESDRRRAGSAGESAAVGSKYQVADPVPERTGHDEQQPVVDLEPRRGVLQPTRRCDERDPGDAQSGAGRRYAEEHAAADGAGTAGAARDGRWRRRPTVGNAERYCSAGAAEY